MLISSLSEANLAYVYLLDVKMEFFQDLEELQERANYSRSSYALSEWYRSAYPVVLDNFLKLANVILDANFPEPNDNELLRYQEQLRDIITQAIEIPTKTKILDDSTV